VETTARNGLRTALFAISAFAACSVAAAVRSRGFIESDGATHFIFARHAFEQPIYFIDIWGRPLCTALFSIPAHFGGLIAVRITSMLTAVAAAVIAAAIARGQGIRPPVLALIFTLGQPLLFLHSFSELTELPFAVVIGLAFLSYQRRRFWLMAIFAAIAPLGRPEGFVFLLLAAFALLAHRKFLAAAILPLGLIAWSFVGHALTDPPDRPWWHWLFDHWPYEARSAYPPGPLLYFVAVLPMVVGPFALPAVIVGCIQSLKVTYPLSNLKNHKACVTAFLAAIPLGILVGHSILHWLGGFSSSGAPRYLLIVAPLWGCLAARGWEWAFNEFHWRRPVSWAALAVVIPGLVNYCWRVLPVQQTNSWAQAEQVVGWYEHSPLRKDYPRLMSNHPAVFFYFNASPWDESRVQPWNPTALDHPPPGILMIWDPEFCVRNSDPRLVAPLDRLARAGWIDDSHSAWATGVNGPDPIRDPSLCWHILLSGK
jgi:hypothetical protein